MGRPLAYVIVLVCLLVGTSAAAKGPFETPEISVGEREGERAVITVTLTPIKDAAYPTGPVPFTAEPFSIFVSPASGVVEYNLFNSGLAMDLDGDGKASGTIPMGCFAGGVLKLGESPVRPFVENPGTEGWRGTYRDPDGSPRIAQIAKTGAWYATYTPCGPDQPTTVALAKTQKEIAIHEVPGPALQLLVFEEVFIPSLAPTLEIGTLTLNAKKLRKPFKASTHAYEPIFDEQPVWHAVVWRMIPLGERLAAHTLRASMTLPADGRRRMVIAIINQSSAPDLRERSGSAILRL